ncbi:hypothetical protein Tco_0298535 [Tanacetum coccineum]
MVPVEESSITFMIICVLQPDLQKEKWLYPKVVFSYGCLWVAQFRAASPKRPARDLVLLLQPLRHSHLDTFSVEVKKRATSSIYLGIRDSSLTHHLDERSKVAEFSGLQSSRRLTYDSEESEGVCHLALLALLENVDIV